MPRPCFAGIVLTGVLLSGCAAQAAGSVKTATPLPTSAPTATVAVNFTVAVTPHPTARPRVHTVPVPRPTRFVAPRGPYLVVSPSWGPPASRDIHVRGGNLEPSSQVNIVWGPKGRAGGVSMSAYTDKLGRMSTTFTVPGSAPGAYEVTVTIDGTPWASARYVVRSLARVAVDVQPGSAGERVAVRGRHFLPRLQLVLIAYPLFHRAKPIVVGSIKSGGRGSFLFRGTTRRLKPGQYVLRAWSANALTAQMAEGFFQVVI